MGKIFTDYPVEKFGYPREFDYNNLEQFNPYMGIRVFDLDMDNNVLNDYVGERDDKQEIISALLEDLDNLIVIDNKQINNGEIVNIKCVYLPYKNELCTKWHDTYCTTCIEDYADESKYDEIYLEIALGYYGLERFVPLKYRSYGKGTSMMKYFSSVMNSLKEILASHSDNKEIDNYLVSLADAFGIHTIEDTKDLVLVMYNHAGEKIDLELKDLDQLELMVRSIRILKIVSSEDKED